MRRTVVIVLGGLAGLGRVVQLHFGFSELTRHKVEISPVDATRVLVNFHHLGPLKLLEIPVFHDQRFRLFDEPLLHGCSVLQNGWNLPLECSVLQELWGERPALIPAAH